MQHPVLVHLLLLLPLLSAAAAEPVDKCAVCGRLIDAFDEGLRRTAKDNFGGGNTHWEESRLGSYAHSETRLVDIQDRLCSSEGKEAAAACHAMLEQFEEAIEAWWFGEFKASGSAAPPAGLRDLLCVRRAGLCCPRGAFGPQCATCPACSARGACEGNGTRGGSGRCQCEPEYAGDLCDECAAGHFRADGPQPPQEPLRAGPVCLPCHPACGPGGCDGGSGAGNCRDCAPGYAPVGDGGGGGCVDVDECAAGACSEPHERCANSPGSFACDCEPGYRRAEGGGRECVPAPVEGGESAETGGGETAESGEEESSETRDDQQARQSQEASDGRDEL